MAGDIGFLDIEGHQLEYRRWGPEPSRAPTLVMLHEGLGSVGLWGEFPARIAQAAGIGVFAYSRAGYGASSSVPLPRTPSYMHDEALHTLPRVLDAIGFRRGLLLGHSDGASIATIYTGGIADHRIRGLILMAPHFFTEEVTVAEIARTKALFTHGDLRRRLMRWHTHVDVAFKGWHDAWLDPAFRSWDITEYLAYIRVPIAIVQGEDDQYGTTAQIAAAERECYCPVDVSLLPGVRHSPHRDAPDETLALVTAFLERVLVVHQEGIVSAGSHD